MVKKHIVIVGGGPGGLCAGMLLTSRGYKVTVLDKNAEVGGRNRSLKADGFTFDVGPTFLLMKGVLDQMFSLCGKQSTDYLEFIRLDPMYKLYFDDRDIFVYSDPAKMREALKEAFPEGEADYEAFLEQEEKRFRALYPCITHDYSSLKSFLSWQTIKALPYLALHKTIFANLGRYFNQEKMRLVFSFQSKYLGMSPWDCPALFTMLSFLEHRYGIYHVKGGLNQISAAMATVIQEQGGTIFTDTAVKSLMIDNQTVTGVKLADETVIRADEVIVNADFAYAMSELVEPTLLKRYSLEKLKKKEYSCSTFMLYLGLDRVFDLPHHNVVFAEAYKENVFDIFKHKMLSEEFSFYLQNACVTDDSLAPKGKSTFYILVPVPNQQGGIDWQQQRSMMREAVLDAISKRLGVDNIENHIEYEKIMTPDNWQFDENVFYGATFNLSHKINQMLCWRPHNKFEELDCCYLVGGGTHPGSGLPTIFQSAKISANLICQKYGDSGLNSNNQDWL